ncbi:MAG: thioredoxin-disulfide reductase [Clostridiales bacterium]|jgi:thioredoxin reductase (NADPH)|nr:thioredoxin-disulfide reductase [Clostridiales bacterium]
MHDIIILGGGPAGLTAALYGGRYGLEVMLVEEALLGGQTINTNNIENYPGFPEPISGDELSELFEKQVAAYHPQIVNEEVKSLDLVSPVKKVITNKGTHKSKTIIIALGSRPRKLGVENEDAFLGRGVSYCATCDGNFFKKMDVAVVGGGDTAITEAMFLSHICNKVYLIHRRTTFRAADALVKNLAYLPNVELALNSKVKWLKGEGKLAGANVTSITNDLGKLAGVVITDSSDNERTLDVKALFVAVGAEPNATIFKDIIAADKYGYIKTDEEMRTSITGVYAAGDIRKKSLRQIVTAAADGAIAAHSAMLFLQQENA